MDALAEQRDEFIELRRAPCWQLMLADRPMGKVVRTLAWGGPEPAGSEIETLKRKRPQSQLTNLWRSLRSSRRVLRRVSSKSPMVVAPTIWP